MQSKVKVVKSQEYSQRDRWMFWKQVVRDMGLKEAKRRRRHGLFKTMIDEAGAVKYCVNEISTTTSTRPPPRPVLSLLPLCCPVELADLR